MYFELFGTHRFVKEFKFGDGENFALMITFMDNTQAHFVADENNLVTPYTVGVEEEGIYFSGPIIAGSAIHVDTVMAFLWKYYPQIGNAMYGVGNMIEKVSSIHEDEEY